MTATDMSLEETLKYLTILVRDSLKFWDIPQDASVKLINVSENATYLVEGPNGYRSVLRVHRENYHSHRAIECEIAWSKALNEADIVETPEVIIGKDGDPIQSHHVAGLPSPRFMVLFEFVEGEQPDESHDLVEPFRQLGAIAAKTHSHSIMWKKPEPFERLTWDVDAVFGPSPTWGKWFDAPNVTSEIRSLLTRVESKVRSRLDVFGRGPERYGLIHADMRLANLLIEGSHTRLIDFDDCGFGWFLYDFATGISFMEDHAQVPALKAAWVEGYRSIRPLSRLEETEIDTFVMMRRLALLAWIGSHIEAPEPQALAKDFARVSAELGEAYLQKFD